MATATVTYSMTSDRRIQATTVFNGKTYLSIGVDKIAAVQHLAALIRSDQLRSSLVAPGPEIITL